MTELGQTRDPTALVPGDPAAVRANAAELKTRSDHVEKAGDGLVDIDTGAWTGPAAEEFRNRFSYEPNKWYLAANSLATAASALTTYAHALEWAQQQAAEAVRLWDEAQAETQQAEQAYEEAAVRAPPEHPLGPFVDTGASLRQNAIDVLSAARKEVGTAGDVAARFLDQEAESAPNKSSWLDKVGGFLQDAGARAVNGLASFGNAMVHHPGETASLVGGLLLTEVSALGEGTGFVLDATGVGAVGGVPLNIVSAAGITVGAGMTASASGLLMQHAASDDAITPVRTGRSEPVGPTKTDNCKEHLTDRDLDAARRELNGEVVATKSTGKPWDHVNEVRNAQDGLVNRIGQLKRLLGDSRVSAADRAQYEAELSEASRLLDYSEQFVPRI
ncbi:polymorphic toxin type 28 domain-containing protein [Couchioplanes caeruleus]|uniref:putative T7SS-secreted protein n=1 Tax=Couchioplanes caeruleus TaxID=56438 RepID=UPI0020BE8C12|nr:polymorphic toxin type 28 domain-containing protein [Couchioplanes caeruleus]UQU64316.1 polymorphic toxin type 28 domain-containing protein [Couchioplanes caeruleus]